MEQALAATGIGPLAKRAITTMTSRPWGYDKRRDLLNNLVLDTKELPMA